MSRIRARLLPGTRLKPLFSLFQNLPFETSKVIVSLPIGPICLCGMMDCLPECPFLEGESLGIDQGTLLIDVMLNDLRVGTELYRLLRLAMECDGATGPG